MCFLNWQFYAGTLEAAEQTKGHRLQTLPVRSRLRQNSNCI
jgi:hypothetical protein